jgi:RHS repeat-associated protein
MNPLFSASTAYDANNMQRYFCDGTEAACPAAVVTGEYRYDAGGNRVEKIVGTNTTTYVYNAFGQVAAEYETAPQTMGREPGRFFRTTDHLGSTRLVTRADGTVKTRRDFFPFGEEILDTYGNRQAVTDLQPDSTQAATYKLFSATSEYSQQFTGQERDDESALEFFGARYSSVRLGRFTTADPIMLMPEKLVDPQQWNMYSYVRNNPLRLIDPTGMYVCSGTQRECKQFEKQRQNLLNSKNTDVRTGATAFGGAGQDNGVTVSFVNPKNDPSFKKKDGSATANLAIDPNDPSKFRANVDVRIKKGEFGVDLRDTIAHEGIHTRDAQAFAATATMSGQFDLSKNLTVWQTELNAYAVSAAVWAEAGKTSQFGNCGRGPCSFGPGLSPQQVRGTTIRFLADPKNGYNRFVDTGGPHPFVNKLGMRQFPAITTPAP